MSKVLLVNDCKFESIIMKDILENIGYDVEITNEYDAMNRVKYSYPDIVIANLVMKTIQGDELIKNIKGFSSGIKCILSSSNAITLDKYKNNGVDAVVHTPINKSELKNALDCKIENLSKQKSEFKFCPYCGNKLNESFLFCPGCGHRL